MSAESLAARDEDLLEIIVGLECELTGIRQVAGRCERVVPVQAARFVVELRRVVSEFQVPGVSAVPRRGVDPIRRVIDRLVQLRALVDETAVRNSLALTVLAMERQREFPVLRGEESAANAPGLAIMFHVDPSQRRRQGCHFPGRVPAYPVVRQRQRITSGSEVGRIGCVVAVFWNRVVAQEKIVAALLAALDDAGARIEPEVLE